MIFGDKFRHCVLLYDLFQEIEQFKRSGDLRIFGSVFEKHEELMVLHKNYWRSEDRVIKKITEEVSELKKICCIGKPDLSSSLDIELSL